MHCLGGSGGFCYRVSSAFAPVLTHMLSFRLKTDPFTHSSGELFALLIGLPLYLSIGMVIRSKVCSVLLTTPLRKGREVAL